MKKNDLKNYGLIGDIGGTNARFALVNLNDNDDIKLLEQKTLACVDYANINDAVSSFLSNANVDVKRIETASIAVAGTVESDWFEMTNNHWQFSIDAVTKKLGFKKISLLNDFAAIAWSLPLLRENEWIALGHGEVDAHAPVAVIGPGTGLGVGGFVPTSDGLYVLQTEGGHGDFAPTNDREIQILQYLMEKFSRVSNERLLSGPGLENIYAALKHANKISLPERTAAEITHAALEEKDIFCIKILNQFCAILGSVAGDLALMLGAKGGVYIAGGIVPRFVEFLQQSPFRQRFEAKGRFDIYNKKIATRVVMLEQPGLLGAAVHQCAINKVNKLKY